MKTKCSVDFEVFATAWLKMKILVLFGLIIAINLSRVNGNSVSKGLQETLGRPKFFVYTEAKVEAVLEKEKNVTNSTPLLNYPIKHKKIQQELTVKTVKKIVGDEGLYLSQILFDLEKAFMRKVDQQYINILNKTDLANININKNVDLVSEKIDIVSRNIIENIGMVSEKKDLAHININSNFDFLSNKIYDKVVQIINHIDIGVTETVKKEIGDVKEELGKLEDEIREIKKMSKKFEDKVLPKINSMETGLKETIKKEIGGVKEEIQEIQETSRSTCEQLQMVEEICPEGWTRNEDQPYCYYFGTDKEKMKSADANAYCQRMGGTLVLIKTEQENKFILSKMTTRSWLGLDDLKVQGRYEWNDGTVATFTYWGKGEPNGKSERCVEYASNSAYGGFFWNDKSCSSDLNSPICQRTLKKINLRQRISNVEAELKQTVIRELDDMKEKIKEVTVEIGKIKELSRITSERTLLIEEICPEGWTRNEDKSYCYYFGTKYQRMNYADAKTFCRGRGGTVLSVKTEQENKFILSNMMIPCWLGLDDLRKQGRYEWSDGSVPTYTDWRRGEPGNINERCVEYYDHDGIGFQWNDKSCASKDDNAPICKRTTIFRQFRE